MIVELHDLISIDGLTYRFCDVIESRNLDAIYASHDSSANAMVSDVYLMRENLVDKYDRATRWRRQFGAEVVITKTRGN